MKRPWQILDEVLDRGDQKQLAFGLHLSPQLVSGWTLPPKREGGEGEISPIERTIEMVEILRRSGNAKAEDLVRYVNESLGYMAPVRMPEGAAMGEVAVFLKETSEALAAHARSIADKTLTIEEIEELIREYADVSGSVVGITAWLENERKILVAQRNGK